jgi:hypothetical protein
LLSAGADVTAKGGSCGRLTTGFAPKQRLAQKIALVENRRLAMTRLSSYESFLQNAAQERRIAG